MKLVITDEAKADLRQIGEWIAEDNPVRALSFVDELEDRCARLIEMPRAYLSACTASRKQWRAARTSRRRPYFLPRPADTIDILHVLNGARDYEPILFPDEWTSQARPPQYTSV
jgi:toxin ParE1/3/4